MTNFAVATCYHVLHISISVFSTFLVTTKLEIQGLEYWCVSLQPVSETDEDVHLAFASH